MNNLLFGYGHRVNYSKVVNISNKKLTNISFIISGYCLLLLYIAQLQFDIKLEFLYELQQNSVYKQITGYLLFIYVAYQFRLAKVRNNIKMLAHVISLHKIQGVFAPLVLYIHSMQLGYAYQVLLSILFLSNCAIGLLSPQQLKTRNVTYSNVWLVAHVTIAVLVVALIFYHFYITYWYS